MVNVAGFENTIAVSQKLKGMVQQFGDDILNNPDKFVSLMNDFIPEYEKERRLLKNVVKSDILAKLRRSDNQDIAIMKAKEYMINDMFLSEGAVEFVMVCFAFLLDWNYETTMPEQGGMEAPAQAFTPQPQFTPTPDPFGGAQMGGYGQQMQQQMGGYGQQMGGYGQQMGGYGQQMGGYGQQMGGYGNPMDMQQMGGYGNPADMQQMGGYGAPQMQQQPVQQSAPQEAPAPQIQQPVMAQPEEDPIIFTAADASKSRLRGTVKVPTGYTTLADFCFDGFTFMKVVELPASLITIGTYAFSECKRLKTVTLPLSIRIIKSGAFSSCAKLTKINIPSGVTEIPDNTFEFCHNLEVVDLPTTLISIGNGAFQGCESLTELFLPESVKQIADDAFANCNYLTIKCYDNSYAYRFCRENNIKVKLIG